jgi:hypothetical protein
MNRLALSRWRQGFEPYLDCSKAGSEAICWPSDAVSAFDYSADTPPNRTHAGKRRTLVNRNRWSVGWSAGGEQDVRRGSDQARHSSMDGGISGGLCQ